METSKTTATSSDDELAEDLSPMLKIYKSGRVERLVGTATVAPSIDPLTAVESHDVIISADASLTARIYLPPKHADQNKTPPLVVYFHGGGFLIESAASPMYHSYLNSLSAKAGAVVLSLDYRLAPEHPLPAAYDDAMAALGWIPSLGDRADLRRVYLAGDSAGANIAHRAALLWSMKGDLGGGGVELKGIVVVHPYFWGEEPVGSEAAAVDPATKVYFRRSWVAACPGTVGFDDPWINPAKDPDLGRLGCGKVVVFVAEKDLFKDRGLYYCNALKKSGWSGTHQVVETKGEGHVFHLFNPACDEALEMMDKICTFVNS